MQKMAESTKPYQAGHTMCWGIKALSSLSSQHKTNQSLISYVEVKETTSRTV
jgi:hypothetical protein